MGWLGRIFGTEKAISDLTDKDNGLLTQVGGWIGNMHYTEEDRAEAARDTREWGIRQLDALAPFKVTQRVLAIITAIVWVFMILNIVGAMWLGKDDLVTDLITLATSQYVGWPTISVFALYFTGGVVDSWRRKPKDSG